MMVFGRRGLLSRVGAVLIVLLMSGVVGTAEVKAQSSAPRATPTIKVLCEGPDGTTTIYSYGVVFCQASVLPAPGGPVPGPDHTVLPSGEVQHHLSGDFAILGGDPVRPENCGPNGAPPTEYTCTATFQADGGHTPYIVGMRYYGDDAYLPGTATFGDPLTSRTSMPTTTTLVCVPGATAPGVATTCTATVVNTFPSELSGSAASGPMSWTASDASALGAPTCDLVDVTDLSHGAAFGTSRCSVTYTPTAAGPQTISANTGSVVSDQAQSDCCHGPSHGSFTLQVGADTTRLINFQASGNLVYGGSTTLAATLDTPAPSGYTIAFTLDGAPVGNATTDAAGLATLPNVPLGTLAPGSHAIAASFAGTAGKAAASTTGSLTISKAHTTIASDNVSLASGTTSVTLTATVTSPPLTQAVNEGQVQFVLSTSTTPKGISVQAPVVNGVASVTVDPCLLPQTTNDLIDYQVQYSGGTNFADTAALPSFTFTFLPDGLPSLVCTTMGPTESSTLRLMYGQQASVKLSFGVGSVADTTTFIAQRESNPGLGFSLRALDTNHAPVSTLKPGATFDASFQLDSATRAAAGIPNLGLVGLFEVSGSDRPSMPLSSLSSANRVAFAVDRLGHFAILNSAGATHPLTVTRAGTGSGTVTSAPVGIDCGQTCSHTYDDATTVTLTAAPASGSTFSGWSAGCTSVNGLTCTVALRAATTITATFALPTATLTVTRAGSGSGTVTSTPSGITCGQDCSESFASGTRVTLVATPASGSTFGGWSGACTGADACVVTMDQARTVTATFAISPGVTSTTATLTVAKDGAGSGTVTSTPGGIDCGAACSHDFGAGSVVALTATPASGSSFAGWSGACTGTAGCQVTMSEAKHLVARFTLATPATVTLTVSKSGSGLGTVTSSPAGITCGATCQMQVPTGTHVTLTAAPAGGNDLSRFAGWGGACDKADAACRLVVDRDLTVSASFPRVEAGVQVGRHQQSSPTDDPALVVTFTARPGCGGIAKIQLGVDGHPFANARVSVTSAIDGQAEHPTGFTYTPSGGTTSVSLIVHRVTPVGGVTISPIRLVDGCGEWQTFVGGGPEAFR